MLPGGRLLHQWKGAMCSVETREKGRELLEQLLLNPSFPTTTLLSLITEIRKGCWGKTYSTERKVCVTRHMAEFWVRTVYISRHHSFLFMLQWSVNILTSHFHYLCRSLVLFQCALLRTAAVVLTPSPEAQLLISWSVQVQCSTTSWRHRFASPSSSSPASSELLCHSFWLGWRLRDWVWQPLQRLIQRRSLTQQRPLVMDENVLSAEECRLDTFIV